MPQPRSLQQQFSLRYRYDVHFTPDAFGPDQSIVADVLRDALRGALRGARLILPVIDSNVALHHPNLVAQLLALRDVVEPLIIPGGEICKTDPRHLDQLYATIERSKLCRHSCILAIGGGAVLDLAGFAAATAHRGMRLVRMPTTTLAQNDSGVGVKNGVNKFGKKNFVGTFAPPGAVINDSRFLATLSDRDWRSGIAEAVKVALVKDADFFDWIESHAPAFASRDAAVMNELIYRCAKLHLDHIATGGDPFETGSSRPLDFGHWSAHKLEQLTGFELRHGEAVAIGIALDCTYSLGAGWLTRDEWSRVLDVLTTCGFALHATQMSDTAAMLEGLGEFQEHLGGELTVMMLRRIGRGFEVHEVDPQMVKTAVKILETRK